MANTALPAIRMQDVRFRWNRNAGMVLDIATLDIAKGERLFIKGPSGSGKTTLLNLLAGIAVPETGSVTVLDTNIAALSGASRDAFRARHIGVIFQMFNLVPYLSLVENVVLPCRFSATRHERALSRSESLAGEARRLLQHMDLDVDMFAARPVTQLSVGQQQRVAAARALIGAPSLVIADEPTSSLDVEVRRSFLNLLFREVAEADSTLIFVSHDPGLAADFDRTITLADINRANEAA